MTQLAKNWINQEWLDSPIHTTSINPATYEKIGEYADAQLDDAQKAVEAAKFAFKNTNWANDRALRAQALFELADVFEKSLNESDKEVRYSTGSYNKQGVYQEYLYFTREYRR